LLAYDADPKTTLQFLRDRLHLDFNHEQRARDQKPNLPTTLDPARISREAFQQEALRDSDDLAHCSVEALERLVREKTALRPPQQRALLARLQRTGSPGLVDLIVTDLKRARRAAASGNSPSIVPCFRINSTSSPGNFPPD
jgi:hypothetical protein